MTTLLFLATALTLVFFLIRLAVEIVRKRRKTTSIAWISGIVIFYGLCWMIAYFKSTDNQVPLGTRICFDDWCATVTSVETADSIGNVHPGGRFVMLHVSMINEARRIAQKPSEPRMIIADDRGDAWRVSVTGQSAYEAIHGQQNALDARLELNETLGTVLVFDLPAGGRNFKAVIEEGPFITRLLLPQDRQVFSVPK